MIYKSEVWTAEGKDFENQVFEMDKKLSELGSTPQKWRVHTCNSFKYQTAQGETMVFHYLLESTKPEKMR